MLSRGGWMMANKKGRMGGREVFVEYEKFSEFMVIRELCRCGCWESGHQQVMG